MKEDLRTKIENLTRKPISYFNSGTFHPFPEQQFYLNKAEDILIDPRV